MQSAFTHHHFWTALATTGVILSAAYMLSMIQRVFYCDLGRTPRTIAPRDLNVREHLALWPMVALFLVMGVASPIWLKAIDGAAVAMADHPAVNQTALPNSALKLEAHTAGPAGTTATQTTPGGAR
jgi:NADH-quinone oxidoreductase subunit M